MHMNLFFVLHNVHTYYNCLTVYSSKFISNAYGQNSSTFYSILKLFTGGSCRFITSQAYRNQCNSKCKDSARTKVHQLSWISISEIFQPIIP